MTSYVATTAEHAKSTKSRNLVSSSGHVGQKFLRKERKEEEEPLQLQQQQQSKSSTANNIYSNTEYYRGQKLNPATNAASKMLSRGNLDVRFGIFGEEEEILECLHAHACTDITLKEVQTWTKSGGQACCLVAERDDKVVIACRCTGIRGNSSNKDGGKVVTLDCLAIPQNQDGERFVVKSIGMCYSWSCGTIHINVSTSNDTLLHFIKKCIEEKKKNMKIVESYDASKGPIISLQLTVR